MPMDSARASIWILRPVATSSQPSEKQPCGHPSSTVLDSPRKYGAFVHHRNGPVREARFVKNADGSP